MPFILLHNLSGIFVIECLFFWWLQRGIFSLRSKITIFLQIFEIGYNLIQAKLGRQDYTTWKKIINNCF